MNLQVDLLFCGLFLVSIVVFVKNSISRRDKWTPEQEIEKLMSFKWQFLNAKSFTIFCQRIGQTTVIPIKLSRNYTITGRILKQSHTTQKQNKDQVHLVTSYILTIFGVIICDGRFWSQKTWGHQCSCIFRNVFRYTAPPTLSIQL